MKPMFPISSSLFEIRQVSSLLAVGLFVSLLTMMSPAAEPHEKFLQRLRDNNYFDLALVYLDDAQNSSGLDSKFKSVIDLERALLYFQAASTLSVRAPQRAEKLNQTEKFLRKFIADSPQHPRRGEARLKLGGLLRLRAEEAIELAGPNTERGVADAINFFDSAHKLYEEAIGELAQIEGTLKGARVDPQDTEKVAYRNQVRLDLREAQLYSAKAIEDRGRSRGKDDPARKADLEKSLEMYRELYRKETSLAGIRTFALLYRSGVQATMGLNEDAIDGYQRIVDMENVDQLRPLQTEALTALIQVLASEEKHQPAAERAEAWISKLRKDEEDQPEVSALKLAYAKVRIDWKKKLSETDDRLAGRIDKAVRSDLRALIRVPGPHVDEAKELLASLGVDTQQAKSTVELPKVKDLAEAIEESQKRIDDADNNALAIVMLEEQINSPDTADDQKSSLTTQLQSQQEQVEQLRRSSLELLRIGLQKYDGKKDDRTQLFNARFRIAYLLLKLKDTREAIVVGEFLSRTSPGTAQGLNAAAIVLEGFSALLKNTKEADHSSIMTELAPFAEYLVATWPQSAEAAAASGALTQLAVVAKDWDQAEKYLQNLPSTSPGVGRQYFDLGASLFDQYQKLIRDKSSDEATVNSLRERSSKWLKLAHETIAIDDSTANFVLVAANALAQLRLSQDQIDEASALMFSGDKAPMNWLESKLDKVTPASAMDAYRTAMRIVAAQVVDGKLDTKTAVASMQSYVNKLQELGNKSDEGRQRLQSIFTGIASDLKEKLAMVKQAEKRAELSDVVLIVVGEAAKSESYNTQVWAATTLVSIAEGLETTGQKSAAEQVFTKAAQLLKQMLTQASSKPGWAPENAANTLRISLARVSEGSNDLRGALEAYAEVLDQNNNYLDVQIGVARTLQKSAANNAGLYKSAISGARPHATTKQNVFWGWGKIGQEASKKIDNYSEQFYEARYQLANCRMLYALSLPDPKSRAKELVGAEKAINDTVALYPGLGGAGDIQRYDSLLKKIQKEAGKPETGLSKK